MNTKNMKFGITTVLFISLFSILSIGGCDVSFSTNNDNGGGSGSGDIIIEGTILNFAEFGDITVTVRQDNIRLDTNTTDASGNFRLQLRTTAEVVSLEFESASFGAELPNFSVEDESTSILDITLQQNPSLISIDRWQVFQDILSLFGTTEIEFIESTVEFNIEGDDGNCIFATGTVMITYRVKSINITGCREGIRLQGSASIILEADESIFISSSRDAILTLDDAMVDIGQTTNPIDNTVIIESIDQIGINAAGNSVVNINPENECSISGGREAVNVNSNATVNTSTCTLSL